MPVEFAWCEDWPQLRSGPGARGRTARQGLDMAGAGVVRHV